MKRRCPWAEDHQPMLKNHFSEKDQVLKSGGMESIYAKTLAMLFNGANKKAPENNNEEGIYAPKFLLTTTGVGNCSVINRTSALVCLGCRDWKKCIVIPMFFSTSVNDADIVTVITLIPLWIHSFFVTTYKITMLVREV